MKKASQQIVSKASTTRSLVAAITTNPGTSPRATATDSFSSSDADGGWRAAPWCGVDEGQEGNLGNEGDEDNASPHVGRR
jgi:hypothetical protein